MNRKMTSIHKEYRSDAFWNISLAAMFSGMFFACLVQAGGPAPFSELYLTGYTIAGGCGSQLVVVQNNGVERKWPAVGADTCSKAFALAVFDTVRTIGVRPGSENIGAEYTLRRNPTGATYPYPLSLNMDIPDGTTDGAHNYAGGYFDGTVYRFSRMWTNPTPLFSTGFCPGGVTYDATNNSLWAMNSCELSGSTVRNYAMDGTLLSSFNVVSEEGQQPIGLAMDPADHTLWLSRNNTNDPFNSDVHLEQYSTTGQFLYSRSFPSLHGMIVSGMEFRLPHKY